MQYNAPQKFDYIFFGYLAYDPASTHFVKVSIATVAFSGTVGQ
jgi:hypothetical protein